MRTAKRLLVFVALVLPGMAAAVDDVTGYQKTRWGMT